MPARAWVALIVGLIASVGVLFTWHQKNIADSRSEWWRRITWALERTFSDIDAEAEVGWRVLETLVASRLATSADSDLVQVVAEHVALSDQYGFYDRPQDDEEKDYDDVDAEEEAND